MSSTRFRRHLAAKFILMRNAIFFLFFFFAFSQSISAAEPSTPAVSDTISLNETTKVSINDSITLDIACIAGGSTIVAAGTVFTILAITADSDSWNFWPIPAILSFGLGIPMLVDNIISLANHKQYAREQKDQQSSNFIIFPQFDWVHSSLGIGLSIKF